MHDSHSYAHSMRLEQVPILLGALVFLMGLALTVDVMQAEGMGPFRERRRRARARVNRTGEALVAAGSYCTGAALIGRDTWRYGTIVIILGTLLLFAGAVMNRDYLKEILLFRGASRRGPEGSSQNERKRAPDEEPPPRNRIR